MMVGVVWGCAGPYKYPASQPDASNIGPWGVSFSGWLPNSFKIAAHSRRCQSAVDTSPPLRMM